MTFPQMNLLWTSPVFMYLQLLPHGGLFKINEIKKDRSRVKFLECEDKYVHLVFLFGSKLTLLTHMCLASHFWDLGNSADPDEMPQNAASDQGLHCFLTGICVGNIIRKKKKYTRHP